MKWKKIFAIFLFLFLSASFCFSQVSLSVEQLTEIRTLLQNSNILLDNSILSPQDLQNIDDRVQKYISSLEARLQTLDKTLEREKKLSERFSNDLKNLKTLSENLKKQISDLKKSSLENQIKIGALCFGGGLIIGVIAGIVIK